MYSTSTDENDENCVAANMYTVFWFNKQNEFDIFFFFLKVHKRENFFGSDFEICTFS